MRALPGARGYVVGLGGSLTAFSASGGVRFYTPLLRASRTGKRIIESIQCHYCDTQTSGVEILPGKVLHLCTACYDEIQQTIGNSIDFLSFVKKVLNELNIPTPDRGIIAEALVWTEERKQAWNALLGKDRRLIRAIIHVLKLFDSDNNSDSDSDSENSQGEVFMHLPRPIVRCIRRCSRSALFTAMGECLRFELGDVKFLLHIMEIFDYEIFEFELPPDPLWPLIENGSRVERISVILECVDVLLGTNGLKRIKKIRNRHKKLARESKRLNRNHK